jgi:hypothetical protein
LASVVAAMRWRRRRRRRLVAGAVVVGSDSIMQQTSETSCRPETWWTGKWALYPLSMHCSYKSRKSSLVVQLRML